MRLPTIFDTLDASGISYKYYETSTNPTGTLALWDGPSQVQNVCNPIGGLTNPCNTSNGQYSHVSTPQTNICGSPNGSTGICTTGDIVNGVLPQVSFVIPTQAASDHPDMTTCSTTCSGPDWVASIINTVGSTSYWNNTAICVVWDDWGGYYDHVIPPLNGNNSWYAGMRVPLFCVSAYSKQGVVDSTTRNSTSILQFIKKTFGAPTSTPISSVSIETATDALDSMFCYTCVANSYNPIPYP